MRKSLVYRHFKSLQAIASALGITKSAVSQWPEVIPKGAAYELEWFTKGKLKVDQKLYKGRLTKVKGKRAAA